MADSCSRELPRVNPSDDGVSHFSCGLEWLSAKRIRVGEVLAFWACASVAEADANGPGGLDEFAFGFDEAEL
ncbi:MAG: hypothetical protein NTU84_07040, partial [Verrucomicrobia bacterium]|nr:hypothetical protein [Verrucomicrobiota bacterium]